MLRKKLLIITFCVVGNGTATQQKHFDQASNEYKSMNTTTLQNKNLSTQVAAQDYHTGDVNAVSAKNYYADAVAMESAKQSHFANSPAAQALHQATTINKHEIDPNNPAYQKAIGHQANAEQILSDENERYDCQHIYQDRGKTTYTEKCQVSNIVPMQCSRYPVVTITPAQDINFNGQSSVGYRHGAHYAGAYFTFPHTGILKSFKVTATASNEISTFRFFWSDVQYRMTWHSHYHIKISPIIEHIDAHVSTNVLTYHYGNLNISVTAGQKGNFHAQQVLGWVPDFTIAYSGIIQVAPTQASIIVKDNCQHINKEACVKMSETCVEPAATRNFDGINVHQDCWKYDYTYKCGYKKHDNCDEIAKRCDFISQKCIEASHGFCYAYERTYQCNSAQIGTKKLICGNPNSIQFSQTLDQANPDDFMQAVSALAGAGEMAKALKDANAEVAMLKGNAMDCGEGAMGVYDCCDGGGHFLHGCSDSEKALQQARQKKIATYVGRYCAKKVLGGCVAHHQVWCVFESKLARILQEQGRRNQLGVSFGSAEHPNCQGIPVHDLKRIDFTKIDFREFYDEVKSKVTLPDDKTANSMFNKFKAGKTAPEINIKQKNSRITT